MNADRVSAKRPVKAQARELILAAARKVLSRDGAASLSTRSVAAAAGVNLSLIHYHFGSREGLLLAVLEQMNSELLARQRGMYARSDLSLADKWRRAIEFYRQDLKSGYVRTLLELSAHGYSNPRIATSVRALIAGWRDLLTDAAKSALDSLDVTAITADEVVAVVASYWYGMEVQHLLGMPEEEGHLWHTAEKIGELIEQLEDGRR
jgi:AcrR family transcriptional regulator